LRAKKKEKKTKLKKTKSKSMSLEEIENNIKTIQEKIEQIEDDRDDYQIEIKKYSRGGTPNKKTKRRLTIDEYQRKISILNGYIREQKFAMRNLQIEREKLIKSQNMKKEE